MPEHNNRGVIARWYSRSHFRSDNGEIYRRAAWISLCVGLARTVMWPPTSERYLLSGSPLEQPFQQTKCVEQIHRSSCCGKRGNVAYCSPSTFWLGHLGSAALHGSNVVVYQWLRSKDIPRDGRFHRSLRCSPVSISVPSGTSQRTRIFGEIQDASNAAPLHPNVDLLRNGKHIAFY